MRPDFEKDLDGCLATLQTGGLICYPTDTIWGIGCDATNADAVKKIFALKQRTESKTLIVLVADPRDILKYTSQPDPRIFDFLAATKKPTTMIYKGPLGLADNLTAPDNTIAIRLVRETFCKHLIKRFRKPIVSTSANISARPAPANYAQIDEQILQGVDYIVRYRQDEMSPTQPSAIMKWNSDGTTTTIRP
jgi:L-threonylcarbamoyladenylate synthase